MLEPEIYILITAPSGSQVVRSYTERSPAEQVYDDLNLEFGRGALRLSGQTKIRGRQEALRAGYYTFQVITRVPVTWQQAGLPTLQTLWSFLALKLQHLVLALQPKLLAA